MSGDKMSNCEFHTNMPKMKLSKKETSVVIFYDKISLYATWINKGQCEHWKIDY